MTTKKALSGKDMNGQKIVNLGDASANTDAATKQQVDAAAAYGASLANATGTMAHDKINDWDTAVQAKRLDQFQAPNSAVAWNSQRITGLGDPSSAQDAATRNYVDTAIAGLSAGMAFKGRARAATNVNISISSAPATIDGVSPSVGDVFLLLNQSTGAEGGPRVWNGAGTAMPRPANFDTAGEAVPASFWVVSQGTYDNQIAILVNDTFTLDTTTPLWDFLNPAQAADNDTGYTETSPVVSAGNAWAVNHNLNSKALLVQVYRSASPFDELDVAVTRDTVNQINIRPDVALASGEFTVVIAKVV